MIRSSNRKQFVTVLECWQDSATLVLDLDDQILLISEHMDRFPAISKIACVEM